MSKTQDYFSARLSPDDIDLSGICYRIPVNEDENATYIFLGEKPPSNVIYAKDLYYCGGICECCECDHCKKTFMED